MKRAGGKMCLKDLGRTEEGTNKSREKPGEASQGDPELTLKG